MYFTISSRIKRGGDGDEEEQEIEEEGIDKEEHHGMRTKLSLRDNMK